MTKWKLFGKIFINNNNKQLKIKKLWQSKAAEKKM